MRLSQLFVILIFLVSGSLSFANDSEIIEKRGFFSKTYRLSSGLEKMIVHSEPIHFKNSVGSFAEIPELTGVERDSLLNLAMMQSAGSTRDFNYPPAIYHGMISSYIDTTHDSQGNIISVDSCYIESEDNFVLEESLDDTTQMNEDHRFFSKYQVYIPNFEPWYEIQSMSHKMNISWYTEFGETDDGYFSFYLKDFDDDASLSDCGLYDRIGEGDNYYYFTVDRFDNGSYEGEKSTNLSAFASALQDSIEQSPQPIHMNLYFAYLLGGESYHLEDDFILQFASAPTIEIIYKTTIPGTLANRYLPIPLADMGGTLSLIDHTNSAHNISHVESLDPVELNPGDTCTALTDSIDINNQEFHQHSWSSETASSYTIKLSDFIINENETEISAFFNDQFALGLSSGVPVVSLKDPWYVSNRTADPEDWIQPDTFRTVSQMLADNSNLVFEDENADFDTTKPIYYLNTPQFTSAGGGLYYFFTQWGGSNVLYGVGQTTTTNNETPVVFTTTNAAPVASFRTLTVTGSGTVSMEGEDIYILAALNQSISGSSFTKSAPTPSANVTLTTVSAPEGYSKYLVTMTGDGSITYSTVPISSGDEVILTANFQTIAAGTNLNMPSNTNIRVMDHSRLLGSEAQPITFHGLNGATWNGLDLAEMDRDEKLSHVVIKNATVAISPEADITYCRIENVLVDSASYGFGSQVHISGLISIEDSEFSNISTAGIYCATEEDYLVDTLIIKDCEIASSTAGQGSGIQMSPLMTTAYGNFKYVDITGVNIDGFSKGIDMEFHAGLGDNPQLNWQSNFSRVRLNNNRIENCTGYGVRILGEHALFSHHNIIANCDTAYYVESESGHIGHGQDGYSHRILNETLVDNMFGVYFEQLTSGWDQVGYLGASLFYGNTTNMDLNNDLTDQGNLTSNPLFVDYANGDYNLTGSSPGVDAGWEDFDGDTDTWTTDTDDQDADGTRMDAGALFYNPAPQAPVLSLQAISGNNPVLSWALSATGSGYPDRDIDHFTIYKRYYTSKFNNSTSYVYNHSNQSYTDNGFGVNPSGPTTAYYKVLAIDEVSKSSGWSNTKNTKGLIAMKSTVLPDSYEMRMAYPNPFNPITNVDYALPMNANVDLRIYDLRGRVVYQEIAVNQSAGWYTLKWMGHDTRGQSLPSGIYIISLQAIGIARGESYEGEMNFSQTRKVMLMK